MKKTLFFLIIFFFPFTFSFGAEISEKEKEVVILEGKMFGIKRSVSYIDFFISYDGNVYFCKSRYVRRYNPKNSQNILKCFDSN